MSERLPSPVKRSTKSHEAETSFVRAILCDFVDRSYPSGRKHGNKLEQPTKADFTFSIYLNLCNLRIKLES